MTINSFHLSHTKQLNSSKLFVPTHLGWWLKPKSSAAAWLLVCAEEHRVEKSLIGLKIPSTDVHAAPKCILFARSEARTCVAVDAPALHTIFWSPWNWLCTALGLHNICMTTWTLALPFEAELHQLSCQGSLCYHKDRSTICTIEMLVC